MPTLSGLPRANPSVVLREEFDDYALLFDPSNDRGFGLDTVGVAIWKMLDGRHSIDSILSAVRDAFDSVPDDASAHISAFIDDLIVEGLAGYELA